MFRFFFFFKMPTNIDQVNQSELSLGFYPLEYYSN